MISLETTKGKKKELVDADSNADFDVQLESLYPVWNEREKWPEN